MRRLALKKLSAAELADKFSVPDRDFAAHGDDVRSPFDFKTFERIVIEVHLVGPGRNFAAVIGIVNDQALGVASLMRAA